MFSLISGHPKVHSWSSKHTEEDIYIMYVYVTQLKICKIIGNFKLI